MDTAYIDAYLYHYGDTNTRLYFTTDRLRTYIGSEYLLDLYEGAQDYVKLGDGGDVDINLNDMMFVNGSNGNVGIGTTSPGSKLHVSASDASGRVRVEQTGTSGTNNPMYQIYNENSFEGAFAYMESRDNIEFFTSKSGSVPQVVIDSSSGNVGIGTTAPKGQLDIDGYVVDRYIGSTPDPLTGDPAYLLLCKESSNCKFIGRVFGYRGSATATSRMVDIEVAIDLSSLHNDVVRVGRKMATSEKNVNLVNLTYGGQRWYAIQFINNNFAGMAVGIEAYYTETDAERLTFKRSADVSVDSTISSCPGGSTKYNGWCMDHTLQTAATHTNAMATCNNINMQICPLDAMAGCDAINGPHCTETDAGAGNEQWVGFVTLTSGDSWSSSCSTLDGNNLLYSRACGSSDNTNRYHCCKPAV
jgi:hypothetical protein